jgi:hypothetical protein
MLTTKLKEVSAALAVEAVATCRVLQTDVYFALLVDKQHGK